jgi:hypothetical protein
MTRVSLGGTVVVVVGGVDVVVVLDDVVVEGVDDGVLVSNATGIVSSGSSAVPTWTRPNTMPPVIAAPTTTRRILERVDTESKRVEGCLPYEAIHPSNISGFRPYLA